MHLEIHRRKRPYYFNMILGGIGFYVTFTSLVFQIRAPQFNHWYTLLLVAAVAICCLVVYKALKQIANKMPALIITNEGLVDQASPLKVGLIKWDEIVECKLKQYNGYLQLMLTLDDNSRVEALASGKQQKYLSKVLRVNNAAVIINTEQLNCKPKELLELIDDQISDQVYFDDHLIVN